MMVVRTPLAELKKQLEKHLAAAPANDSLAPPRFLATGSARLDALLGGGWPRGRIVEVAGGWSSGKTSLLFASMAEVTRRRQLCAWVDARGELYPPSAAALGVDLDRLLIVRPSRKGSARAGEIVARSGAFPLVVLDLPDGERLEDAATGRLRAAAGTSGTVIAALAPCAGAVAQAAVKLEVAGDELRVRKGGAGGPGTTGEVDRGFYWHGRKAEELPGGLELVRRWR